MKILKFGGKSLANGAGLRNVIDIIEKKIETGDQITVVLSARGNATDELELILEQAVQNKNYKKQLEAFKEYQQAVQKELHLENEFEALDKLFEGVSLLKEYSPKIKDEVLAHGEVISAKAVTALLKERAINAQFTDSRKLIVTDEVFGNAQPLESLSKDNVLRYFSEDKKNTVHVVTGFIASNLNNETTTLGRNGSNYTAALLANYLEAEELQNYTHVDGIFTANPDVISSAKKIEQLSYKEANELANFGANILHAKTIIPLIEKNIPLRILNTFNPENKGTLITSKETNQGIKSVSVQKEVALLNLEGRGLLGKAGVDARIFSALAKNEISVSIISQGSSERGIGLVVSKNQAKMAQVALEHEFSKDFYTKDVSAISIDQNIAVISIIGQDLSTFHKPYNALIKNQITPILFNNTVTGKNVSLVVEKQYVHKALHVIHGEIFGIAKKINIAIFGHGLVGGTLIDQILASKQEILERKKIELNIFAIANSTKVLLKEKGIDTSWKETINTTGKSYQLRDIITYAEDHHLENLIAVDNTASADFVHHYETLIESGFDIVSSNKIANTISFDFYKTLRKKLDENQKEYRYETNVGAGLPLIDTIKLLHLSGENITKIKGVFSGSLSYLFNTFSVEERPFSQIVQEAIDKGYTEPDPREDLCGNDVGRKLLILARELDLKNEFEDIEIQNLIPENLRKGTTQEFLEAKENLDPLYHQIKKEQKPNHVLRYIGELSGDLSLEKGKLEVKLESIPIHSALGQIKGSDSIFEIYTESYGNQPLVIQGAGAGAAVTARGVFGDILRITEKGL